jgi:Fe-S-cluster containining protein
MNGTIALCPYQGCEYRCCRFDQGNYIVLHPGELEAARASGASTAHLQIIDDDYHGGQKAVCTAAEPMTCDYGYKPLDCKSYPLFPAPDGGLLKGSKCPLRPEHLTEHARDVGELWERQSLSTRRWLAEVRLVGYEVYADGAGPPAAVEKGEGVAQAQPVAEAAVAETLEAGGEYAYGTV